MDSTRLSVRGVAIALKDRVLIKDADIKLAAGDALCLIGRNGSGKSTLMRVMAGLQRPTAGCAQLIGAAAQARVAGVWGGRAGIQQKLSVWENINYFAHLNKVKGGAQAQGERLLARLELWDERHKLAGRLSSGFKMRLALAIALISEPEILFLDEPDSNVDAQSLASIISLLQAYKAAGGAIVCASHEPELVLQIATRVCQICPGGILAHLSQDEIRAAGKTTCYRLELCRPASPSVFADCGVDVRALGANEFLVPNLETNLAKVIQSAAPYGVSSLKLLTNPIDGLLAGGAPC